MIPELPAATSVLPSHTGGNSRSPRSNPAASGSARRGRHPRRTGPKGVSIRDHCAAGGSFRYHPARGGSICPRPARPSRRRAALRNSTSSPERPTDWSRRSGASRPLPDRPPRAPLFLPDDATMGGRREAELTEPLQPGHGMGGCSWAQNLSFRFQLPRSRPLRKIARFRPVRNWNSTVCMAMSALLSDSVPFEGPRRWVNLVSLTHNERAGWWAGKKEVVAYAVEPRSYRADA